MEFRQSFRDEPPAPLPPPPPPQFWLEPPTPSQPRSSCDVISEQRTTRARCINPEYGIGCNVEYFGKDTGRANGDVDMFNNVDPDIQRALEKQKIREEIVAAEMARRRELEAEVREELRIERELALRMKRGNAFESVHVPMEHSGKSLPQEVEGLSLEEKVDETSHEMEKINFLAKPSAESAYPYATQRKAFIPPKESTTYTVFGIWGVRNIEGRKEWRCFICQDSANSETDLKQHFKGNKHRSKRAALQAEKSAATIVPQIGVKAVHLSQSEPLLPTQSPNVSAKPLDGNSMLSVFPENKNKAKGKEKFGESANSETDLKKHFNGNKHQSKRAALQAEKGAATIVPQIGVKAVHLNRSEPLLPTQSPNVSAKPLDGNSMLSVLPENKNKPKGKEKFGEASEKVSMRKGRNNKYVMEAHEKGKQHLEKLQKKFPFWCGLCKVGADHAHIMNAHLKGKKHLNMLQEKAASSSIKALIDRAR